jgi:hypothetical protein
MAHRYPFERVFLQLHEQFLRCGSDATVWIVHSRMGISINQASVIPSYTVPALGLSVNHY